MNCRRGVMLSRGSCSMGVAILSGMIVREAEFLSQLHGVRRDLVAAAGQHDLSFVKLLWNLFSDG